MYICNIIQYGIVEKNLHIYLNIFYTVCSNSCYHWLGFESLQYVSIQLESYMSSDPAPPPPLPLLLNIHKEALLIREIHVTGGVV